MVRSRAVVQPAGVVHDETTSRFGGFALAGDAIGRYLSARAKAEGAAAPPSAGMSLPAPLLFARQPVTVAVHLRAGTVLQEIRRLLA